MYKGKLKTGEEVAVKVQRPFVLETVTVDLFIIRSATACDPSLLLALSHSISFLQPVIRSLLSMAGTVKALSASLVNCRKIGLFMRRFPQLQTDVVALLDEWAVHFFEELDYVHEVCPAPLRGVKS